MKDRSATRATAMGVCTTAIALALTWAGCSDDEKTPPPATTTPDGSLGQDVSTIPDAPVAETKPLDGTTCTDVPPDCTKNAGNTGVDGNDAGLGSEAGAPGQVPIDLRCTGLYACFSTGEVAPEFKKYTPAFQLYSDGAEKSRWLFLPPNTTIDTGGSDAGNPEEWIWPVGTMVYKEFQLGGKRVETRRIWKAGPNEFVYSVWRWSDDQTQATLTFAGDVIANPSKPGHAYEVPKINACEQCHAGHKDKFLSLDAWGLGAPGAQGLSLAQLKADNKLSSWSYPTSFAVPEDSTGKLHDVLAFQYNNCGFCHKPGRPGAATGLQLHMPIAAALPNGLPDGDGGLADGGAGLPASELPIYKTGVGVTHVNTAGANYDTTNYKRITPGNADASVLFLRDERRGLDGGALDPYQMPPVLVRTVDDANIQKTRDWINALP